MASCPATPVVAARSGTRARGHSHRPWCLRPLRSHPCLSPSVRYHSIGMSERYRVPDRLSVRSASIGQSAAEVSITLGRREARGSRGSVWLYTCALPARLRRLRLWPLGPCPFPRTPRPPLRACVRGKTRSLSGPLRARGRQRARISGNPTKCARHSPRKKFPETGARTRPRARKHDELAVGHLPPACRSRRPTAHPSLPGESVAL